jgi:mannan endo-1,4-beta-mannosidase
MNIFKLLWISIIIITSSTLCKAVDTPKAKPINQHATKEAKQLLSYLYAISGSKTLTGQHNMMNSKSKVTDSVMSLTGYYPAVWGGDFGFADSTHNTDNIMYRPLLVPEIIKQHKRGSLITMCYHQANPVIGEPCQFEGGVISKLTDEQWNEMLTPGTPLYEAWRKQVDKLAVELDRLQQLHIPILFRPYHEMNGKWFWWGGKPGDQGYVRLWKQLYHYYTDVKKLNNLIWVWSPDKPWHGLKEYYPGNDYVDVVGCDIYPVKDTTVVFRKEWYDQLLEVAGEKPLAIGECSLLPDAALLKEQPRWVWFMGWSDMTYQNSAKTLKELYNLPNIVNAPVKLKK